MEVGPDAEPLGNGTGHQVPSEKGRSLSHTDETVSASSPTHRWAYTLSARSVIGDLNATSSGR
jgi:hypothetical protein